MDVVVEHVVNNCLKLQKPPTEVAIGTDARFLFMALSMLPASLLDMPQPMIPAAMQGSK
jgi:hypothetical protein